MQTKVFGAYDGPEEVLRTTPLTTDINITSNYAPTGTVAVRVIDADGRAVENADVTFNIYNYAQYFPFVTKRSDADGKASFICGHGDMVVFKYRLEAVARASGAGGTTLFPLLAACVRAATRRVDLQ